MKPRRKSKARERTPESNTYRLDDSSPRPLISVRGSRKAFTLIELMVVVAIMGIILATGIPSFYRILKKGEMRKTTSDVVELLSNARARAIFRGAPTDVMFYPLQHRLAIAGGGGPPAGQTSGGTAAESPSSSENSGLGVQIPDNISIEMLDINLSEYKESDWARVRFYPNGTSDELTLILHSNKNEWKKITLEVTTGLASVDNVVQ
jgi:prepilin-type N-terminal cleavage/methylation domain-containing protein